MANTGFVLGIRRTVADLENFEASNKPPDRLARIRETVVLHPVDGALGGVPVDPEVLQDARNGLIHNVVDLRVMGKNVISDTREEVFQDRRHRGIVLQIRERADCIA